MIDDLPRESWRGVDIYRCPHCQRDSMDPHAMVAHIAAEHTPAPSPLLTARMKETADATHHRPRHHRPGPEPDGGGGDH